MGQNLILNMDSKGFVVCAYNRTVDKVSNKQQNRRLESLIASSRLFADLMTSQRITCNFSSAVVN